LASGLLGFSLAGMAYYTEKDNETLYRPLKVSSLIFGGLLGYNLLKLYKINTEIKQNLANMTVIEVEKFRADSARHYFSSGMEMIGKEEYNDALLKFNFVVNVFPDSGYTPISIYEIGYCHYQMGNVQKAIEYFRRFVFDYPIYELFPYGVYYLLDLELASGDVNQALKDFTVLKPVHLDDASGDLHRDYFRILETIYKRMDEPDISILLPLNDEIAYFLEKNKNSSSYPEIYLLHGKMLYDYIDREEGIRILNDVRKTYNYDQELMKELDSILNAG
jgi:tetratricopeptide (TPR) repeat protein